MEVASEEAVGVETELEIEGGVGVACPAAENAYVLAVVVEHQELVADKTGIQTQHEGEGVVVVPEKLTAAEAEDGGGAEVEAASA